MPNTVPDFSDYQQVALGIIERRNQILISKRLTNSHLGGLWEFPGGKLEAGEDSFQALYRELNEELGIHIQQAEPGISLPWVYQAGTSQETRLLLHAWHIPGFNGRPAAREKQQLRWVNIEQLSLFDFPQANHAIITSILLPSFYFITPSLPDDMTQYDAYLQHFRAVCQHGLDMVQIRCKQNCDNRVMKELLAIANAWKLRVQINFDTWKKYPELLDTNNKKMGIHLTAQALHTQDIAALKQQCPGYLSASCHQYDDIVRANQQQIDFITLSPVNPTASHPQQQSMGWGGFKALCSSAQMPVYALGGMNFEDRATAKSAGAQGIACIRAIWDRIT